MHDPTFKRYLSSGQINALPAYAASTCNHTLGKRCKAIPISCNASNEQEPVVPKVVETKNGTSP